MSALLVDSVRSLTLDLPPSCIQFCPTHPQLFVVGTYYLHVKEQQHGTDAPAGASDDDAEVEEEGIAQKRTGSLILFHLEDDNANITQLHTTPTDFAILDLQWSRHHPEKLGGGDVLAVATSTGGIAFYRIRTDNPTADAADTAEDGNQQQRNHRLVLSCIKQITSPTILVLSLTWHPTRPHVLGITLSDGNVCLCESTDRSTLWSQDSVILTQEIHSHELEAWTLAFAPDAAEKGNTKVLSGGDDMLLLCSHINDTQDRVLLWQERKLHEAGVTAILPLSKTLVVTGSYDDSIRLLYLPAVGRRKCLASLDLGGGVWRLKLLDTTTSLLPGTPDAVVKNSSSDSSDSNLALPDPENTTSLQQQFVLLASCMHAGTRIVKLTQQHQSRDRNEQHADEDGGWQFEVLAKFEEHQSMNYGSDVQPPIATLSGENVAGLRKKTIVSTSFYDKKMCLWRI